MKSTFPLFPDSASALSGRVDILYVIWVLISLFFTFRRVTSRSLSPSVISSGPSCISPAWGCQEDISTLLKGDIITLPRQFVSIRSQTAGESPIS